MKNYKYRRPNGTDRRIRRMEDKMDVIILSLNRINSRLQTIECQQRGDFVDETINRLHASAIRMKDMAEIERKIIEEVAKYETALETKRVLSR